MTHPSPGKQIDYYFPKDTLDRHGTTIEELEPALHHAVERFITDLGRLTDRQLHHPIRADAWTPAQFADHLYRATLLYQHAIDNVLQGNDPQPTQRDWLKDGNRMITVPEAEPKAGRPRPKLIQDLRASTTQLIHAARRAETAGRLHHTCYHNPYFGLLAPLECLQLAITHAHYHAKRHLAKPSTTVVPKQTKLHD